MNILKLCNYEILETKASNDQGSVELGDGTTLTVHDGRGLDEKEETYLEISYGLGEPERDDEGGWVWKERQVVSYIRAAEEMWVAIDTLAQAHFNPPPIGRP